MYCIKFSLFKKSSIIIKELIILITFILITHIIMNASVDLIHSFSIVFK
jgi:hypothetical protein